MPPRRGEGMTDTLSGRVHHQGSGTGESHTTPIAPQAPTPRSRFFAGAPACASSGERQGPPAAPRSASGPSLTPTLHEARIEPAEQPKATETTSLTRPRSFRNDYSSAPSGSLLGRYSYSPRVLATTRSGFACSCLDSQDPALRGTGFILRSHCRARGQWSPGRGIWRCS